MDILIFFGVIALTAAILNWWSSWSLRARERKGIPPDQRLYFHTPETYSTTPSLQPPLEQQQQVARLAWNGAYEFNAVGESHYQRALRKIVSGYGFERGEYVRIETHARLVHDDKNPYDDKAIAVYIDDMKVAHLPRAEARDFRKQLAESGAEGLDALCGALICGGDSDRPSYGVFLDLPIR